MNILESKEKLRKYCENVYYFNDDKKWCFFYDENENDTESISIQNKVKKLIESLNSGDLKYLDMDIENDLYDMLSDDIECLSSN